jgi:hypothetical protein
MKLIKLKLAKCTDMLLPSFYVDVFVVHNEREFSSWTTGTIALSLKQQYQTSKLLTMYFYIALSESPVFHYDLRKVKNMPRIKKSNLQSKS